MSDEREAMELIDAYSDLVQLYHDAYAAHHGEGGPAGCPCCAEFAPEMATVMARVAVAIESWRVTADA